MIKPVNVKILDNKYHSYKDINESLPKEDWSRMLTNSVIVSFTYATGKDFSDAILEVHGFAVEDIGYTRDIWTKNLVSSNSNDRIIDIRYMFKDKDDLENFKKNYPNY